MHERKTVISLVKRERKKIAPSKKVGAVVRALSRLVRYMDPRVLCETYGAITTKRALVALASIAFVLWFGGGGGPAALVVLIYALAALVPTSPLAHEEARVIDLQNKTQAIIDKRIAERDAEAFFAEQNMVPDTESHCEDTQSELSELSRIAAAAKARSQKMNE